MHALVAVGLLLSSSILWFYKRGSEVAWVFPFVCFVALVLHPAWTVSALRGDCGLVKVILAQVVSVLLGLSIVVQLACSFRRTPPALQSDTDMRSLAELPRYPR